MCKREEVPEEDHTAQESSSCPLCSLNLFYEGSSYEHCALKTPNPGWEFSIPDAVFLLTVGSFLLTIDLFSYN